MPKHFDWVVADTESQNKESLSDHSNIPRERFLKKHYKLILGTIFLSIIVSISSYQFNKNLDEVKTHKTNTIKTTFELLLQTTIEEDLELFNLFLSDSYPLWKAENQDLLSQKLFLDRNTLNLWFNPSKESQISQILLSSNLAQAEIVTKLPYLSRDFRGEIEEIELERTLVFQQENSSWKLSQPDYAFWGEYLLDEKENLTLSYPKRDAKIVTRLANDLEKLLEELCELQTDCKAVTHLNLRFSKDLASITNLRISNFQSSYFDAKDLEYHAIELPTPTLIGVPIDEPSYQAVYRSYASLIVSLLLSNTPPENLSDFNREALLTNLALPWPSSSSREFVQGKLDNAQQNQDIQILCDPKSTDQALRKYNPAIKTWINEIFDQDRMIPYEMLTTPKDNGVLLNVQQTVAGQDHWQLLRWEHGIKQIVAQEAEPYYFAWWWPNKIHTENQYVFVTTSNDIDEEKTFKFLDMWGCLDSLCSFNELNFWIQMHANRLSGETFGVPNPSSNLIVPSQRKSNQIGGYNLFSDRFSPFRKEGQVVGEIQYQDVEVSTKPLGFTTNIILSLEDNPESMQLVLTSDDVANELSYPPLPDHAQIIIHKAIINPANPEQLFVNAILLYAHQDTASVSFGEGHILLFNFVEDKLNKIDLPFSGYPMFDINFVPGSDFLLISFTIEDSGQLFFYDLDSNDWFTVNTMSNLKTSVDWSENGQWLLITESDHIRLIAPKHQYEQILIPENSCNIWNAVWVNR